MSMKKIVEKYGEFGSGGRVLFIDDKPISIKRVMRRLDLLREDIGPVDCGAVADERYFVRFIDLDDRTIAVFEFDPAYRIVGEVRSDLMEWMGDDYFRAKWRVYCPAGGEEWLGRDMSKFRK
jgi:hypothetical protein